MLLMTCNLRDLARSFRTNADGGVVLLFALGLPALSILALGAVEISEIAGAKSKLQSGVDSAALKGAGELSTDQTAATTERTRQFADERADRMLPRWTVGTEVLANAGLGSMKVTQEATRPSFFGSLLPPGGFHLRATATATNLSRTPLCILALQGSGAQVASVQNNAAISAAGCLLQSNRDVSATNNARITAGKVQAATSASGNISPAPMTDVPARADPFAAMPINVPTSCTTNYNVSIGYGTYSINPGVHCGTIDVYGSAVINLNPGEHYFVGGSLTMRGNAQVSGTDVVLVFKGQSAIDFSGNTVLNLEGRTTGTHAGFVMVADRSFTGTMTVSTSNARKLLGTIYLPNGILAVSGITNTRVADLSKWTIVVANKLEVTGAATLTINSDYVGGGSVPVPSGAGPKLGTGTRLEQ
jgi:Flp pilus assembly protein TadG